MQVNITISKEKKRGPQLLSWIIIIFSFVLFLLLSFLPKEKSSKIPTPSSSTLPPAASEKIFPSLEKTCLTIPRGKTFSDIMQEHGFTPAQIYEIRQHVKSTYDLAKVKAGQEIRFYTDKEGKVVSFEYDIDSEDYLCIRREGETYSAKVVKIPYETKNRIIQGVIEDNLIFAVNQRGEEDSLALSLADNIFCWDIDFYADLRQGDSFKIIFEKKYLKSQFVGYGNILAAEFTNQGKTFQAFYYTYPDSGNSDHYDFEGNSLRKQFLKSPIPFARISSRFSHSRLHPIRKIYRPHYGVDYAARIGTKVQATGDGIVTQVGWNGASGRMIKIKHKNDYETLYLHLRGYAKGIRKGAKVISGQTIGYVGSSGESTGPHLDYRIKHHKRYINPLAARFKPVKPLRKKFLENFQNKALKFNSCFEMPPIFNEHFRNLLDYFFPLSVFFKQIHSCIYK